MAKRIKTSTCPKCNCEEKLRKYSLEEFIKFSDKDEEMDYEKGIFSYTCIACKKSYSKTLKDIDFNGPCTLNCYGNCERMKVLCKKANLEYVGPAAVPRYHLNGKKNSYSVDEALMELRKDEAKKGVWCDDIETPLY